MSDDRQTKPDVARLTQDAYHSLRTGRVDEAVALFGRVIAIDPSNCYALVGLGDAARKRDDHRAAVEYYRSCLEHDPGNSFALFGLADSYRSLRRYVDAAAIWERYLEHDDRNVTVLTRVADAYRRIRNKRRAMELYERVLSIEPDNAYALIGLGHLHYEHREYEPALESWHRMLEQSGARIDIRVLTSIGNCYRKLKRFPDGVPFFERALGMEPGNFYALFGLADCYRGMHEPQKSLEYWSQILRNDPDNRVILTRTADAHRALGDLDEAERLYKQAIALGPDIYAAIGVAAINRDRGDAETAIEELHRLRSEHPDEIRVCTELAETYAAAGLLDDARAMLRTCESIDPGNPYVRSLASRLG